MQQVDPAAARRRRRPIPWASYLADLEKAGILTGDKQPRRWSA